MIPALTEATIRRLLHAERWPIATIARHLGLHHSTVRRALLGAGGTGWREAAGSVRQQLNMFVIAILAMERGVDPLRAAEAVKVLTPGITGEPMVGGTP